MRRTLSLTIILIAIFMHGVALAQPAVSAEIAPQAKLRVAMNASTVVLVMRTPDGKITGGVGVELGKFMAAKLGAVVELVVYPGSKSRRQ